MGLILHFILVVLCFKIAMSQGWWRATKMLVSYISVLVLIHVSVNVMFYWDIIVRDSTADFVVLATSRIVSAVYCVWMWVDYSNNQYV